MVPCGVMIRGSVGVEQRRLAVNRRLLVGHEEQAGVGGPSQEGTTS